VEEMKKALVEGEANSPIKATVESVLPGVHQQFTNIHNEIIKVKAGVDDVGMQMRQLFQDFAVDQREGMRMTLARNFMNVAVGLVSPSVGAGSPQSPSVPPPSPPTPPTTTTTTTTDDDMKVRPELKNRRRPKSATAIFEEYYGLGEYEGQPIVGGLAAMDSKYHNKWRLGDAGYQKAYSRMQQIVKAVDTEINQGKTQEAVLAEYDALFVGHEQKGLEFLRKLVSHVLPLRGRKGGTVGTNSVPTSMV
jgi:hypothetical protein